MTAVTVWILYAFVAWNRTIRLGALPMAVLLSLTGHARLAVFFCVLGVAMCSFSLGHFVGSTGGPKPK